MPTHASADSIFSTSASSAGPAEDALVEKGGKTLDAYTTSSGDSWGFLTSALFWLLMVGVGVGLRVWMGPSAGSRHTINSLPGLTLPPSKINLNLNLNYNVPPLNLDIYRAVPPPLVRPREERRRRRRPAQPGANTNARPPAATERAGPAATPRE